MYWTLDAPSRYEDIKTIAATNSTNYKELFSEDKHDFSKKVFVESKHLMLFLILIFFYFATPLWWKTGGQGKRAFRYQTFSIHHSFPSLGILLLILKYFHRGFLASRIIAWFSNSQISSHILSWTFSFHSNSQQIQFNLRDLELIWLFDPFSPSNSFAAWGGWGVFSLCNEQHLEDILNLFVCKNIKNRFKFQCGPSPVPRAPGQMGNWI